MLNLCFRLVSKTNSAPFKKKKSNIVKIELDVFQNLHDCGEISKFVNPMLLTVIECVEQSDAERFCVNLSQPEHTCHWWSAR